MDECKHKLLTWRYFFKILMIHISHPWVLGMNPFVNGYGQKLCCKCRQPMENIPNGNINELQYVNKKLKGK